jgi:hypothetical protein
MKSFDVAKLDALNKIYIKEHANCMASIGRNPDGSFISK